MPDERMFKLLDRLLGTVSKLNWKYDEDTDGYYVRFTSEIVEIRSDDQDGRHPYSLLVMDTDERVLESITSSEVATVYREKLADLFVRAKRKEMNIEGVLDSILDQLPEE